MSKLPDPENIDVFVGGVEPDAAAAIETERIIEEYKKRPDHSLKVEEAKRILAALNIKAPDYGIPDAQSLFEHWQKCVAELHRRESREANGTGTPKHPRAKHPRSIRLSIQPAGPGGTDRSPVEARGGGGPSGPSKP